MKKKGFLVFGMLAIVLVLGLVLAGCGGGDSGDGGGNAQQLNTTAETFNATFNSIKDNPGNYIINLTGDLTDHPGTYMGTEGVNITIKGTGSNKITWKYSSESPCNLFVVNNGKLAFENISLGRNTSTTQDWSLISTGGEKGTIEIKNGVVLSNNTGSQYYDGVWVDNNATFIMSGGAISGNGGDGLVIHGTGIRFTMSEGSISKNDHSGFAMHGPDNGFEKKKGAVIYGNTGDNKNGDSAIYVGWKNGDMHIEVGAGKDEVYAATIKADESGIVEGSKQGPNW
jgi:hypothetical protein